ncbi:glycoside hydrolase superfamily, partial [Verticillium dahliae]
MLLSRLQILPLLASTWLSGVSAVAADAGIQSLHERQQKIVTYDGNSVLINGERLMLFSAEFHAFRCQFPVCGLTLQKIKAMGYNCVSFYVNWGLVEAKPGEVRAEGIFSLEPLFEAAQKAGLYLFARPGPYVNAEVTGGGFLAGSSGDADIGTWPVISARWPNQPSNPFPDFDYWNYVDNQFRSVGVVVPYVNNEAWKLGGVTPTTPASVDIYGFDSYPLGFDCWNPNQWPAQGLPTDWLQRHREISPNTPFTIVEFQGGGFQPWGGAGFESCAGLLNHEFERVLFKHAYAAGATLFNVYMTWGGTNWGNLGHSDGYTSYDYGAQITEERLVNREKYSESKLQANFFHVSPAYLEAERHFASLDWTDNAAITVTPATTNTTKFYFTRHTQYSSLETVAYKLTVDTVEYGNLTVPQLSESLFLTRRDSKIHVSDYAVGDKTLVYSTAEIFTWKQYKDKTVLVVYGGPNEHHELAVEGKGDAEVIEGSDVETDQKDGYTILNWEVTEDRKVVRVHKDLYVYILNRNEAYNYWVPPTEADLGTADVIVKAGYLVRTVSIDGSSLSFVGDVNATTPIEVIGGAPTSLKALEFNGKALDFEQDDS